MLFLTPVKESFSLSLSWLLVVAAVFGVPWRVDASLQPPPVLSRDCPSCVPILLLLSRFSRVRLCMTPQMAAHQAPRPWDSPGKNTGVGCHFLLQCMKV